MSKRWEERISDLKKALDRLEEAISISKELDITTLRDGVIQRFEFTMELSWKALKSLLNSEGVEEATTPKSTVKAGYKSGVIKNVEIWLEMLDDRNLTSHIYNQAIADEIYERIVAKYYEELKNNYELLREREVQSWNLD